jgi:hypothetical protein
VIRAALAGYLRAQSNVSETASVGRRPVEVEETFHALDE